MGQKTHPYGFRLGVLKDWRSRWYAEKDFPRLLQEDETIRKYMFRRLAHAAISDVEIERKPSKIVVTVHTARPGVVIGKRGAEVDKLRDEPPAPHFTMEQLREAPPAVLVWEGSKREESDPEEAKTLYQMVFDQHPFSDSVYAALVASGELAIRQAEESGDRGTWEEALEYYNLVTERFAMRAKNAQPFLRKGRILSELGRDEEAIDVLGMVLRNPSWKGHDHAKAHLELGLAYRRQNKLEEAHGFFERLIVAYGGFAETVSWAYYFDLLTLQEMGRDDAVEQLLAEYRTRLDVLSKTDAYELINEEFSL